MASTGLRVARDPYSPESDAAIEAFDDYRSIGTSMRADRKLVYLAEDYAKRAQSGERVPTSSLWELKRWAAAYMWEARCAEHEATLARRSEALLLDDRVSRKRKRMAELDLAADLGRSLLLQLREEIRPSLNPVTEELEYPVPIKTLLAMFPRIVSVMIEAQKQQRVELGEGESESAIVIDQVINVVPPEFREAFREMLQEEANLIPRGDSRPAPRNANASPADG